MTEMPVDKVLHPPLPADLVTFNVRGRIFQTTVSTLRHFPDSILYKMVEYEQRRLRLTSDETGSSPAFFIDRDSDHFAEILRYHDTLEYLGKVEIPTDDKVKSTITPQSLLLEAQYYNIPSLEQKIVLKQSRSVIYECYFIIPSVSPHGHTNGQFRHLNTENDVRLVTFPLTEQLARSCPRAG